MRNLLKILHAYYFLILFLVFETISMILVVQNNSFQRAEFIQFSHSFSGKIYEKVDNFKDYLSLRENNRILSDENNQLRNKLAEFRKVIRDRKDTLIDTTYKQRYTYFSAKVINNTVDKQYNYLTLNKGWRDGIKTDMAVISPKGIVGVVAGVSENFSTVLSVLNRNFKVSAKLKKSNFFGALSWNGINSEICTLNDIPHHVKIVIGDTVITTRYSGIFPEGVTVGVVKEFEIKDGNFYIIKVRLSNDFRSINYVTLVDDLQKQEQQDLEKKLQHD
jgi:rod shape-determining protein MreC